MAVNLLLVVVVVVITLFRDKHFDIKWVDKTHAIGIFSTQEIGTFIFLNFIRIKCYKLQVYCVECKYIL